jgi:8-oxo-dGTP diphosphatase
MGLSGAQKKIVLVAACALVDADRRVLIAQRPEGKPMAGLWEFPGGKVQPEESVEEAAVRECSEETGLAVRAVGRYPERLQDYTHGAVHLHFIRCEPLDPKQQPLDPFRWVERGELTAYEFPAGNQPLLRQLLGDGGS